MLEDLRHIRREIDTIGLLIRNGPKTLATDDPIVERIQDLVLSWAVTVRPGLAAIGVPKEVLNRGDQFSSEVARLASRIYPRAKYLSSLRAFRKVLIDQVLPEVARIPVPQSLTFPITGNLLPEISDVPNQLIPNALYGWAPQLRRFLKEHAFERNVFIMVSYRVKLAPLVKRVKKALSDLRLSPIVAKEHSLTDDLYNPIACLLCCSYGVAIFDRAETTQMHNPNVVYELGMMQLLKRPCVILKHKDLKKMPSDLLSRLYEDYSSQDEAAKKICDWWARISRE